jgi:hypothetical protein
MPRNLRLPLAVFFALLLVDSHGFADGPKDNLPDQVRPVPPVGIDVPAEDRADLQQGLAKLNSAIAALRQRPDARTQQLLPDVDFFDEQWQLKPPR